MRVQCLTRGINIIASFDKLRMRHEGSLPVAFLGLQHRKSRKL